MGIQWDSSELSSHSYALVLHLSKMPSKLLNVLWWRQQAGNMHVFKNEINNSSKCKSLSWPIHFVLYVYCHPQTDCFIVSQLFNVARHAEHFKLGSKQAKLYVGLRILQLSHQANNVNSGIITHYVLAFGCKHFLRYRVPEGSIR